MNISDVEKIIKEVGGELKKVSKTEGEHEIVFREKRIKILVRKEVKKEKELETWRDRLDGSLCVGERKVEHITFFYSFLEFKGGEWKKVEGQWQRRYMQPDRFVLPEPYNILVSMMS